MSQCNAIIASISITLLLALTAIGIRALYFEPDAPSPGGNAGFALVVPGSGEDDDDYEHRTPIRRKCAGRNE